MNRPATEQVVDIPVAAHAGECLQAPGSPLWEPVASMRAPSARTARRRCAAAAAIDVHRRLVRHRRVQDRGDGRTTLDRYRRTALPTSMTTVNFAGRFWSRDRRWAVGSRRMRPDGSETKQHASVNTMMSRSVTTIKMMMVICGRMRALLKHWGK